MRGNKHKFEEICIRYKEKKKNCHESGQILDWNMFPREAVGCLVLEVFKILMDIVLT